MARINYLAICLFKGTISGIVDIKGRSEESARGTQGSATAPSNVPETASQKHPKSTVQSKAALNASNFQISLNELREETTYGVCRFGLPHLHRIPLFRCSIFCAHQLTSETGACPPRYRAVGGDTRSSIAIPFVDPRHSYASSPSRPFTCRIFGL